MEHGPDMPKIADVLKRAEVLRVAVVSQGEPYVVPVSFGYDHGKLYMHGKKSGRKMDAFASGANVAFEATVDVELLPSGTACKTGIRFRSVLGTGTPRVLTDDAEKRHALAVITRHYDEATPLEFGDVARVAVVEITVEEVSYKEAGW